MKSVVITFEGWRGGRPQAARLVKLGGCGGNVHTLIYLYHPTRVDGVDPGRPITTRRDRSIWSDGWSDEKKVRAPWSHYSYMKRYSPSSGDERLLTRNTATAEMTSYLYLILSFHTALDWLLGTSPHRSSSRFQTLHPDSGSVSSPRGGHVREINDRGFCSRS